MTFCPPFFVAGKNELHISCSNVHFRLISEWPVEPTKFTIWPGWCLPHLRAASFLAQAFASDSETYHHHIAYGRISQARATRCAHSILRFRRVRHPTGGGSRRAKQQAGVPVIISRPIPTGDQMLVAMIDRLCSQQNCQRLARAWDVRKTPIIRIMLTSHLNEISGLA